MRFAWVWQENERRTGCHQFLRTGFASISRAGQGVRRRSIARPSISWSSVMLWSTCQEGVWSYCRRNTAETRLSCGIPWGFYLDLAGPCWPMGNRSWSGHRSAYTPSSVLRRAQGSPVPSGNAARFYGPNSGGFESQRGFCTGHIARQVHPQAVVDHLHHPHFNPIFQGPQLLQTFSSFKR